MRNGSPSQSTSTEMAPRGSRPAPAQVAERLALTGQRVRSRCRSGRRGARAWFPRWLEARFRAEPREHVAAVVVRLDFLECPDVGVDLGAGPRGCARLAARSRPMARWTLYEPGAAWPSLRGCGAASAARNTRAKRDRDGAAMSHTFTLAGSSSAAASWSLTRGGEHSRKHPRKVPRTNSRIVMRIAPMARFTTGKGAIRHRGAPGSPR